MLAGGQIAGVSGLLPHCLELKPSRSHASGVTPENNQLWLKDRVVKWSLALILWLRLVSPLPVCLFIPVAIGLCPNSSITDSGARCLDIVCVPVYSWSGQTHDTFHIHILPEVKISQVECDCCCALQE